MGWWQEVIIEVDEKSGENFVVLASWVGQGRLVGSGCYLGVESWSSTCHSSIGFETFIKSRVDANLPCSVGMTEKLFRVGPHQWDMGESNNQGLRSGMEKIFMTLWPHPRAKLGWAKKLNQRLLAYWCWFMEWHMLHQHWIWNWSNRKWILTCHVMM